MDKSTKEIVGFIFLACAIILIVPFAGMLLWNTVLLEVTPLNQPISYWQSWGLLILGNLMFNGYHK